MMFLALPAVAPVLARADADPVVHSSSSLQLVIAALAGIAVIVALIVWGKLHPFLSLTSTKIGRASCRERV